MGWLQSQIETREQLDTKLSERAYANLAASVLPEGRGQSIAFDEIEQADGAIRTVLKYCGVEPGEVPEGITDARERLECLCRTSGAMHRTVHLEGDWYTRAFGAMVGTFEDGQYVALLPSGAQGYCFFNPNTGKKTKVNAATAKMFNSEALLVYRPLPSRSLTVRDLLMFILKAFDRNDYLLVFFSALAVTLVGMLPVWANQVVFDIVVPSGQARLILPLAALLVGVAVSSILISIFRNLIMARVSTKINVAAEAATFSRVLSLPTEFFRKYDSGNLAVRVSQVTMITNMLTQVLLGSLLSSVLSILYIFQIAAYAPPLALPALVIVLVEAVSMAAITYMRTRYNRIAMNANARASGTVTALLGGIQKIKLAGAEDRAFAKWAHQYADYIRASYNIPPVVKLLPVIITGINMVGTIVIYYFAASSQVGLADYMSFNVAFGAVSAAMMTLATIAGDAATIRPMLEMVAPILETVPEVSDDKPSVTDLTGAIDVSSVAFRYGENDPFVLKDLSFKIHPGEYVALVGKSGCGKSTIVRLLLGFEKAERGTITFGPYDVSKVNLRSLRSHIGSVMQDGKLFLGDLASNITVSTPQATIDDAWEAAEIAGIADDIRKMPMGMQTLVSEGSGGVSGGQRQRIMIARAVCGNRRILIFDEATSALDNKTQKHVSDALDNLNCTRVVVAHRLSTVRHCDRILVIDGGKVAEEGTYEELIARKGLFADLVMRQRLEGDA